MSRPSPVLSQPSPHPLPTRPAPEPSAAPSLDGLLERYPCMPDADAPLRALHALLTAAEHLTAGDAAAGDAAAGDAAAGDAAAGDAAAGAAPLPTRAEWLEDAAAWLQAEGGVPSRVGRLAPLEPPGSARLRLLVEVLQEVPVWQQAVSRVVVSVMADTSALWLLATTGLSAGRGLLGDAAASLGRRLLPAAPDERDLAPLLWRLFPDSAWLEALAAEHVAALCALLRRPDGVSAFAPLSGAVEDAVGLLAARAVALGTASDVLPHLPAQPLAHSPFLALPRACEELRVAAREAAPADVLDAARAACVAAVEGCRASAQGVQRHLHENAVDSDLIYRLEQLGRTLERLEALLWLLAPDRPHEVPGATARFLAGLVRAHVRERSVVSMVRSSVRSVARRIFEHTGEVGRHYITESPDEYRRMLRRAAGGGLLTAGTAALKLSITFATLPLFFEGFAAAINYALSFMLIQMLGFTLATKQPSMTGAALAAALDVRSGDRSMRGLVEHLARIGRSQFASVLGNLGAVTAVAVSAGLLWQTLNGAPALSPEMAEYVVHSLHPLKSGTFIFAALTGVLLWCSSVCGGWLENWALYRRLPEALARHRGLIRLVGKSRARRLGQWVGHNACGLGSNVSLGLLLGMTPMVARFFGLHLDVRHVTLSAGTLAYAGTALGPRRLLESDFLAALAGLALVGVVNLTVSFSLGLTAAVRARGLAPVGLLRLGRAVLAGGIRSLSEFVLPPQPLLPAPPPKRPDGVRSAARARSSRDSGVKNSGVNNSGVKKAMH